MPATRTRGRPRKNAANAASPQGRQGEDGAAGRDASRAYIALRACLQDDDVSDPEVASDEDEDLKRIKAMREKRARQELEAEVAMLTRELASIMALADRSRDLAARLKDESDELKSRIESAKDEEERDRKRAEELEEELADQLDELERVNGAGGSGGQRKCHGGAAEKRQSDGVHGVLLSKVMT